MSINSKFQSSLLLRIKLLFGSKWLVDFSAGKTQLVFFDHSSNTGAIDKKMDGAVFEEKSSCKIRGLTFFFKFYWGSYIISIVKTTSKKIGALIRSVKCLSSEAGPYLYKSTIRPCMEYCCHVWAGALPLILEGGPLFILIDCMIVTIPRCYKDVYVSIFFPSTTRLWNSLPVECFLLTNDLNGFRSKINKTF